MLVTTITLIIIIINKVMLDTALIIITDIVMAKIITEFLLTMWILVKLQKLYLGSFSWHIMIQTGRLCLRA